MKKKQIVRTLTNLALIGAFVGGVTILNVAVQEDSLTHQVESSKETKHTRLSVAVVNEDSPVVAEGQSYQLGASYIKKLERDESQNWQVVSRGTAEKGLAEGKYQLMLTIPSDFSSKVLDLKSKTAQPSLITYKVNGGGNLQVENEANVLAKDMVADLNKQLVDMYMQGF